MAGVPTWTELRIDATNLASLQDECYRSVHLLLESDIPELDQKISTLTGRQTNVNVAYKISPRLEHQNQRRRQQQQQQAQSPNQDHPEHQYQHQHSQQPHPHPQPYPFPLLSQHHQQQRLQHEHQPDQLQHKHQPEQHEHEYQPQYNHHCCHQEQLHIQLLHEQMNKQIQKLQQLQQLGQLQQEKQLQHQQKLPSPIPPTTNSSNVQVDFVMHEQLIVPQYFEVNPEQIEVVDERQQSVVPSSNINSQVRMREPTIPKQKKPSISNNELNLNKFEHLRPLPLPLCRYFKENRPDLYTKVEKRDMRLKWISEKRKHLASERIISSLERVRLSSRKGTNNHINNNDRFKQTQLNHKFAPEYRVKSELSEQEIKRRTAKNYRKLPEVKKRLREEVTNHMKVQNYKNKLEYSKKLSENRRQGRINYPLKASYDDRSVTSSRSDFSMNGYVRAADALTSDPLY